MYGRVHGHFPSIFPPKHLRENKSNHMKDHPSHLDHLDHLHIILVSTRITRILTELCGESIP